jgi:hypothetical protein
MSQSAEQQQQVAVEPESDADLSLTPFFAVGLVINLVLIAAFALWAIRQWKQTGKRDSSNSEG